MAVTEHTPTTTSRPRRACTLLVCGTLAFALSACGSDKPTGGGGESAPGGFTPAGGASTSAGVAGTSSGTSAPSGGGTSAAAGTVDQCAVLTASDLQAALGVAPVGAGKAEEGLTGGFCLWPLPSSDNFTVGVKAYASPAEAARLFEDRLTSVHQGGTPVAGLGDKADFTTGNLGANFSDIIVLTGRSILHLRHNADEVPITQAKLTELAATALGHVT